MKLNAKVIAERGTSGIIVIAAVLLYNLFLSGNDIEFAEEITAMGDMAALEISLSRFEDGSVVSVNIGEDGMEIKNSDRMKLEGDVDFSGIGGDLLVLYKQDGVWSEIGRKLAIK